MYQYARFLFNAVNISLLNTRVKQHVYMFVNVTLADYDVTANTKNADNRD